MEYTGFWYFVAGYLFGCIPSALLLVHFASGKDVMQEGTGNVGAMNSYEITGKKWLGISVMLLDMLKGAIPVLGAIYLFGADFREVTSCAVAAVIGHNFNVFLGFKGGRGLATAVGVTLPINPIILILWAIYFGIVWFLIRRQIHIASAAATLLSFVGLLLIPEDWISMLMVNYAYDFREFVTFALALTLVIISRHIRPLIDLYYYKETDISE